MPSELPHEDRAVEKQVGSLGTLPHAPALPDPDLLWIRAQILGRQEAAFAALRNAILARTLRYGLAAAGGTWLLADGVRLDAWLRSGSAAGVTTTALAAFGAALLLGGLVLGRSFAAQRLRDLGLL